jgi:hypothetical protein
MAMRLWCVRNFVDDTWFGEDGYFHSSEMRVKERLWKDGENLVGRRSWMTRRADCAPVMPPRLIKPSMEP